MRARPLLGVAAALLAAVAAASAYAVVSKTGRAQGPSTKWYWASPPGLSISNPAPAVGVFASRSGVDPASIRQVISSPSGLALIVGTDGNGRLCTAEAGTAISGFSCLSDWSDSFAMLLYSTDGGPRLGVVDHASLVGVARPDVARVSITTANGSRDLTLNQWRGFAYDAGSASDVPLSITAYDANGQPLQSEQTESASPNR